MSAGAWRHLRILHLTDLHFGPKHRFDPPKTADGSSAAPAGTISLLKSLRADLASISGPIPGAKTADIRLIVALTGDLTESGDEEQFKRARSFIDGLLSNPVLGQTLSESDIFLVPGNHDLAFADESASRRWVEYCGFESHHRKLMGVDSRMVDPKQPSDLSMIVADDGLLVAQLNSCAYIKKDDKSEVNRGQIDIEALTRLEQQLENMTGEARDGAVRIALIHHHPVVLPMLVDAGKGYDGVVGANPLLTMLSKYRFHAVLHGHKHAPHTFSYDAVCAWTTVPVQPIMVIAGGSAGMGDPSEMPEGPGVTNTYNIIDIKWHPRSYQARVHVHTRGLVRYDKAEGTEMLPYRWHWRTLRIDDRLVSTTRPWKPQTQGTLTKRPRSDAQDKALEDRRSKAITDTHRNYPAIEVMPSLHPGQGYEARVWIESQTGHEEHRELDKVEWSAGPVYDDVYLSLPSQSGSFEARFTYLKPMLIQARLYWKKRKTPSLAYIYARLPQVDP